jgi:hypothetical protein
VSGKDNSSRVIQAGFLYVYDRGYSGFELINSHDEADPTAKSGWSDKAQFVIRYKPAGANSPSLEDALDQPLSQADRDAGVVSDRVGYFRSSSPGRHVILPVLLREVLIATTENGKPSTLRLITNLTDVSATTIGFPDTFDLRQRHNPHTFLHRTSRQLHSGLAAFFK